MAPELADLVTAAKAGDRKAFEGLVRATAADTYTLAYRLTGNEEDAHDVMQEAYLRAWKGLKRYRGDAAFSTWMYRIVTNRCLNMLRARRRTQPLSETQEAPTSRPDRIAEANWQVEDLKRAIARLTPEQRAPLVLRELQGCSYEEIAEALELSIPAVKSRLHRARLGLVAAMRQWQ